jgi:hypothetical protein
MPKAAQRNQDWAEKKLSKVMTLLPGPTGHIDCTYVYTRV